MTLMKLRFSPYLYLLAEAISTFLKYSHLAAENKNVTFLNLDIDMQTNGSDTELLILQRSVVG